MIKIVEKYISKKTKKGIVLDILVLISLLLLILSFILPVSQDTVLFGNSSLEKDVDIGPLGSERVIAFEYEAGDTAVHSIIIPLKRSGGDKNKGTIICKIYENGELSEVQEYKYKDIEKTKFNKKMNLTIELEKTVQDKVRVELYGTGLKARIYAKGTEQTYADFSSYKGEYKLKENIMCDIVGKKDAHPYSWELGMIFVIILMCAVMEKEREHE